MCLCKEEQTLVSIYTPPRPLHTHIHTQLIESTTSQSCSAGLSQKNNGIKQTFNLISKLFLLFFFVFDQSVLF